MAQINGYAAVFFNQTAETEYQIGPNTFERIHSHAFDEALRKDDVVGMFNHDQNQVLGRSSSGTMRLSRDGKGLRYDITPAETPLHDYVLRMQERGDIPGSSFGFVVTDQKHYREEGRNIREIRNVKLFDVGPVTFPAYSGTVDDVRQCRSTATAGCVFHMEEVARDAEFRDTVRQYEERQAAEAEQAIRIYQQQVKLRRLELNDYTERTV